jgi:hypothetical protein
MELKSIRQSPSLLQAVIVALTAVVFALIISGTSLAQSRLPFTGTRTFCGSGFDKGLTTVVTISKDGFATVKTNIWTEPEGSFVTFSGKLSAKGIVRRKRDVYLQIKSAREVVMMGPQDQATCKFCDPREASPERSNEDRRTRTHPVPPAPGTKRVADIVRDGDAKPATSLEEMVRKNGR